VSLAPPSESVQGVVAASTQGGASNVGSDRLGHTGAPVSGSPMGAATISTGERYLYSTMVAIPAAMCLAPAAYGYAAGVARSFIQSGQAVLRLGPALGYELPAAGGVVAAKGVGPLVYGPSAGGRLAQLAESLGGETLTSLEKPVEMGIREFSLRTLDAAAAAGRPIVFDLTNMTNVQGVLDGTVYASKVTTMELQYIQANWGTFQSVVQFLENGGVVGVPW
jgi:hypothetical protein